MINGFKEEIEILKRGLTDNSSIIEEFEQKKRLVEDLKKELTNRTESIQGFHNLVQKLRGNTRVYCRIKPGTQPNKCLKTDDLNPNMLKL